MLVDRPTAAKRYGVSLRYLDMMINDGVIPSIKLARRCVRIPVAEADKSIMRFKAGGAK